METTEKPKKELVLKKIKNEILVKVNENFSGFARHESKFKVQRSRLGSYFIVKDGRITTEIARGLTEAEERYFLPRLLGTSLDETNFYKQVLEYWKDFEFEIPEGIPSVTLNASYEEKLVHIGKDTVPTKIRYPENITDFITFNFIKNHPDVAFKQVDKEREGSFKFILTSKSEERSKALNETSIKIKASKLYNDFSETAIDKLRCVNVLISNNYSFNDKDIKINTFNILEINPSRFLDIASDENLLFKAFIKECVELNIINYDNGVFSYGSRVISENLDNLYKYFSKQDSATELSEIKLKFANNYGSDSIVTLINEKSLNN